MYAFYFPVVYWPHADEWFIIFLFYGCCGRLHFLECGRLHLAISEPIDCEIQSRMLFFNESNVKAADIHLQLTKIGESAV